MPALDRVRWPSGALVTAIFLSLAPASTPHAQSTITLSIVGTNDLHGAVTAVDGKRGLALLGGFIRNLRNVRSGDGGVLLVDAGGLFQGTLESNLNEGAAVISA